MTDTAVAEQSPIEAPLEALAPVPHDRFPCFDGLRAIAAFAVVVYHVTTTYNLETLHGDTWQWTQRLGNFGVSTFFLISGFLLYRPYVAAVFTDDAWLATWSRADGAVPHPVDPIRLPAAVAAMLRPPASTGTAVAPLTR